jgi:hypothetical protein
MPLKKSMTIQIPKISSPAKKYHKKHHPKYHPTLRHFFREQKGTQNAMSHLGVGRIGSYPFRQLPRRFSKLADFTDHRTWFLRREKSCQKGWKTVSCNKMGTTMNNNLFFIVLCF